MEWITNYGNVALAVLLLVVGLVAILWSRKERHNEDDPEMSKVATAFGVVGWVILLIGLFALIKGMI